MTTGHRERLNQTRNGLTGAIVLAVIACVQACERRDAKAVALVKSELALFRLPPGIRAPDEQTGLGEMYAEGTQAFCVLDEKAGQVALDLMLRNAGWTYVSTSPSTATATDVTVWRYSKGQGLGTLSLEAKRQQCGSRFRVNVAEPL